MNENKKLNDYLNRLDKCLGAISAAEKAEIIMEIKSHVLEAKETHNTEAISSILASMGEPEIVANRYRKERHLTPLKPGWGSTMKWITIGFLGMSFLLTALVIVTIWKFTPLVSIKDDGKSAKVEILGGAIKINGLSDSAGDSSVDINVTSEGWQSLESIIKGLSNGMISTGELKLDGKQVYKLKFDFVNAKLDLKTGNRPVFRWDCKFLSTGSGNDTPFEVRGDTVVLSRQGFTGKCDLEIPRGMQTAFHGVNLKMEAAEPHFDLQVDAVNAKMELKPDPNGKYKYDINVRNGKVESVPDSAPDKSAFQISFKALNGKVSFN